MLERLVKINTTYQVVASNLKMNLIKILLIEDNQEDIVLLKQILAKDKRKKYEIEDVKRLADGISHLKRQDYDAVLLSLFLPDSCGLETLQQLSTVCQSPIIVLTTIDDEQIAKTALREGAQDYLLKDELYPSLLSRSIQYAIERYQIAEKLRYSEALYRGIVEDRNELICRFRDNGMLTFANEVCNRYFNMKAGDPLNEIFQAQIFPEDLVLIAADLENLSPSRPIDKLEHRIVIGDDEIRWLQWDIRAIFDSQGQVEYQAVGLDITDKKRSKQDRMRLMASFSESEARFRSMANAAPVLIWMSESNGRCIFFNQPWLDFTGHTLEREFNDDWLENVHPDDRQNCLNIYNTALKDGNCQEIEYRLLHADGEYRWILSTVVPRFIEHGKFAGCISCGIDITKRKQAEIVLDRQVFLEKLYSEITQHIHESLDLLAILETTAQKINKFLDANSIVICKINFELNVSEDLAEKFDYQLLFETFALSFASSCLVDRPLTEKIPDLEIRENLERLKKGQVVAISNSSALVKLATDNDSTNEPTAIDTKRALILVPIILERQLWGLLCAKHTSSARQWQTFEIDLLGQISIQLAVAIQQSELYQKLQAAKDELEKLVVIDSLTEVANRRKFDLYINSEWRRLAREKSPLSLIICDIDYFKDYNDTYGHQAGDLCLQQVALAIAKTIQRPADLVARYGGEEFSVILPNTEVEGALTVAEKIRLAVKELKIAHIASRVDLYITISVGVAGFIPSHDLLPATLITAADQALYDAKRQGRDRVVGSMFS
jgi:diguanylate cyclase (GGDEF)-like protein/PAS domain S-box-containing protein